MPFNRVILIVFIFLTKNILAQETESTISAVNPAIVPINLEVFSGTKGVLVASNFSKSLVPNSNFGIFSIVDFYGTHKVKDQEIKNQYMAQSHLTYKLFNNFNLTAGGFITYATGFRPTTGIQYHIKFNDFFFLFAPRLDLTQTYNSEFLGFVEFTPEIRKNINFYSRLQGLYSQNLKHNTHDISYLRIRMGLSYKVYRFGLGANYSLFGPEKIEENEFGVFLGALLF